MKIKTNDKVQIITGKDKGKAGKVLQIFNKTDKVVVEGLNLSVKNTRPRKMGEKGQQVQFPAPLAVSNVMLVCPKCSKLTKIGYRLAEKSSDQKVQLKGKKFRKCQKCDQVID